MVFAAWLRMGAAGRWPQQKPLAGGLPQDLVGLVGLAGYRGRRLVK
jgi:hypothetical protein